MTVDVLGNLGPLTLLPGLGTPSQILPPLTISDPLAEPHEICDEDNFGTVIWKETPAGEVAAVRCPRNATGEGWQAAGVGGLLSCPHRAVCGAVRCPHRLAPRGCQSKGCVRFWFMPPVG